MTMEIDVNTIEADSVPGHGMRLRAEYSDREIHSHFDVRIYLEYGHIVYEYSADLDSDDREIAVEVTIGCHLDIIFKKIIEDAFNNALFSRARKIGQ